VELVGRAASTIGSRRAVCHDERKLVYGCLPADDRQAAGVEPKGKNFLGTLNSTAAPPRILTFTVAGHRHE